MNTTDQLGAASPRRPSRAGRRQRVQGGFPVVRQIALTAVDGERLATLAALDGMSVGAYASRVIEHHLQACWDGAVPVSAREALGMVVVHSAEVTSLAQELAGIGRLVNQIARHANIHGALPPGSSLARIERELNIARMQVSDTLDGLDKAAATLREHL